MWDKVVKSKKNGMMPRGMKRAAPRGRKKMPRLIAPDDRVHRIMELCDSVDAGKATKAQVAEEVMRLSDELNKEGVSDDYIERMIQSIRLTLTVNHEIRKFSNPP